MSSHFQAFRIGFEYRLQAEVPNTKLVPPKGGTPKQIEVHHE